MTSSTDLFRPSQEPLRTIYDAFQKEASHRKERALDVWIAAERECVFKTACDQAPKYGLRAPTMDEVERAEQMACGHTDYGHKWALYVVEAMRRPVLLSQPRPCI